MKIILFFYFIACVQVCNAQISEVVQSDLSAKELFSNAREILAVLYTDFKKELDDDLGYNIVAYGRYNNLIEDNESYYTESNNFSNSSYLLFRVKITCKEKRYRYIIDDITLIQDKTISKESNTDLITSFIFGINISNTEFLREFDFYKYSEMDSIYRRDSISYYSAKNEFSELNRKKNSAKRKERNRIYKNMEYVGSVMIDRGKVFRATKSFHEQCKRSINSIVMNIKEGMSKKEDW